MASVSIQNMYRVLSKLRMYALRQNSMIDAELAAYNTGFLWLEGVLRQLEQRAFIQTASGEDLREYEALVGLGDNRRLALAARREAVIHRLSLAPYAFTSRELFRSFLAIGIKGTLSEFPVAERIQVEIEEFTDPWTSQEQIALRLDSILPAHLHWDFDYGLLTWNMLEENLVHWDHWDSKDFVWMDFDNKGEMIFA